RPDQPDIQIVARQLDGTEHRSRYQVARIGSSRGHHQAQASITREVRHIGAVPFTDERKSCSKGHIPKPACAVILQKNLWLRTVHMRITIAKQEVNCSIVIEITGIAAHGAPATRNPEFSVFHAECAIAVIVIDAHWLALWRALAVEEGMQNMLF